MPAKRKEIQPLLTEGKMSLHPSKKPVAINMRNYEEKEELDDEDFEEEILLTERKRKRRVSQLGWDATLLILEYFQILALIQSMSLRWVWPEEYLSVAFPVFLFNLDFWEFMKVFSPGSYKSVQGYYTPSSIVPMDFSYLAIAWLVLILVLVAVFIFVYALLYFMDHPQFLSHFARLRKSYFFIIQVLTLPFGTFMAHTFHCNNNKKVDVMNDLTCFAGLHWLYLTFGIVVSLVIFIIFPVYIIYSTRQEALGSCSEHHESFLLLKEMEYKVGLNKFWLIGDIHLFSSYTYWGMYYRAVTQWIKLVLVIIMTAGFHDYFGQAVAVTVFLFFFFALFLILRPFRLTIFNVVLMLSFVALGSLALMGAMATTYNSYTLASPWLLPQYSKWILFGINMAFITCALFFIIYLLLRQCLYHYQCVKFPIWPTFSTSRNDQLSFETKKYIKTFLRARFVLEKAQKIHPMFAPVHELSHQIQILNAYCREAEFLGDAIHGTMLDLLDEMIEIHAELAPKSLFAESVKPTIRETAREFMELVPIFAQRLAQRDYDLILVSPVKKRMLLKMFCMEEEGYYEDLYPDPLELTDSDTIDVSMESSDSEDEGELTFVQMLDQLPDISTIEAPQIRSATGSQLSVNQPSGGSSRSLSAHSRSTALGSDNPGFVLEAQDDGKVSLPGSIDCGEDNPAFDRKDEESLKESKLPTPTPTPTKEENVTEIIDKEQKPDKKGEERKKKYTKRRKSKADLNQSKA
ncbi:hypothetical protein KUTeg_016483 [Tegillarca granosa]|uniref:Uncharacterized protein n=1 Tax=Tegillarca granosa TaxID=220873 RepID=A0ABQ9ERN5_TEGGR|nr:hypothetical protein KUTeg_016483 [Tegillarca granosa]